MKYWNLQVNKWMNSWKFEWSTPNTERQTLHLFSSLKVLFPDSQGRKSVRLQNQTSQLSVPAPRNLSEVLSDFHSLLRLNSLDLHQGDKESHHLQRPQFFSSLPECWCQHTLFSWKSVRWPTKEFVTSAAVQATHRYSGSFWLPSLFSPLCSKAIHVCQYFGDRGQ